MTKARAPTPLAYLERVNLAIDYVMSHLDEPLRLKAVARAARLSPFHFHRVFQMLVGETLADFVKRQRLDRAVGMMAQGRTVSGGKRQSLAAIALACGFSSGPDLSRSFKQRFGVTPSAFDLKAWRETHAGELDALLRRNPARAHLKRLPANDNPDGFRVRIRDLPARTVAYIRVVDPYKPAAVVGAVERLMAWAEGHGFAQNQWLGYQWERPELVPLEQCRYHVAVEAERFVAEGEVGRYRFAAMTVAQIEIRGPIELELSALRWFYGVWLPRSLYVPADQPGFEAWIGRPFAHGGEHFELFAQMPIKRA